MPVKFVAEVVKGLFGISGQSTDEAETETSITVERESDEESGDEPEEAVAEPEEESADGEESGDEPGEAVAEPEEESADGEESGDEPGDSEGQAEPVEEITGIGPTYSERLSAVDIESVEALAEADTAAVADAAEVSESRAADWITQAEDR
jgi:polyhydroxyalkanoate synthase